MEGVAVGLPTCIFMKMHAHVWPCMFMYAHVWPCMFMYAHVCTERFGESSVCPVCVLGWEQHHG